MEKKELLERVVQDRLEKSLSEDLSSEEKEKAFKEAMDALSHSNELEKNEFAKEERKIDRVLKWVELLAIPAGLMTLDYLFKRSHTTRLCNFEKDYTFTTTAGRSLSGLFRFKK